MYESTYGAMVMDGAPLVQYALGDIYRIIYLYASGFGSEWHPSDADHDALTMGLVHREWKAIAMEAKRHPETCS